MQRSDHSMTIFRKFFTESVMQFSPCNTTTYKLLLFNPICPRNHLWDSKVGYLYYTSDREAQVHG